MGKHSQALGSEKISSLILKQSVPASIGILILSIYGIVDTIFVGRYVGTLAIGAISVVMPITFLLSSIGMAIGVGGASIISRALGADDQDRAFLTFGNQAVLTVSLALFFLILGSLFIDEILLFFGANGEILEPAIAYFTVLLPGTPFLAWAMMSNNVIRAEGEPKVAMVTLVVPAVVNMILDPIFIIWLDMGIHGAGLATMISYVMSAIYTLWFFFSGRSELKLQTKNFVPNLPIIKEIFAIGGVTLARQGVISLLSIVLNHSLFQFGREMAVSVFGIINRMLMFANFPVLGLVQGSLPIIGFNYGAKKWSRVRKTVQTSILYGAGMALFIFCFIVFFSHQIAGIFTVDQELIDQSGRALVFVFLATPTLIAQLIASGYYQSIGKARPALFLALMKQGFCLIPLILLLPRYFGLDGIWFAFPAADLITATVNVYFLRKGLMKLPIEPELSMEA